MIPDYKENVKKIEPHAILECDGNWYFVKHNLTNKILGVKRMYPFDAWYEAYIFLINR